MTEAAASISSTKGITISNGGHTLVRHLRVSTAVKCSTATSAVSGRKNALRIQRAAVLTLAASRHANRTSAASICALSGVGTRRSHWWNTFSPNASQ